MGRVWGERVLRKFEKIRSQKTKKSARKEMKNFGGWYTRVKGKEIEDKERQNI